MERTHQRPLHPRTQMETYPLTPLCKPREALVSTQTHPWDYRHGADRRGGMNSAVRAQTPEFLYAGSVPREGNAVPWPRAGGRRVGACAGAKEAVSGEPASPPQEPAVSSGIPGDGRPRACNRGLEASRRPVGPGPDRTRTKCLKPAGPGPRVLNPNVHRPLPRPARARPADSDGFQRSNPQLPRRRPLGPFPPSAPVEKRKKERAAAAALRGPTHHDPRRRRRGDPGGRCAVQGSQRSSAPRSAPPALLTPTHTHAHTQRAHAARPRFPAPSGSRHSRAALRSSGPFRAPTALRPLP